MVYAGADGETADEMAKVLHFDRDQDQFHKEYAIFSQALERKA